MGGRGATFMFRMSQFSFIISRGLRMPRVNFFVAGTVLLRHPLLDTKCGFDMSVLRKSRKNNVLYLFLSFFNLHF